MQQQDLYETSGFGHIRVDYASYYSSAAWHTLSNSLSHRILQIKTYSSARCNIIIIVGLITIKKLFNS